jgi:hypothetical protein
MDQSLVTSAATRWGLFGYILAVISLALEFCAAAPNVVRVAPAALVPGKATVITLLGDNLQGAAELWTSFRGEAVPVVSSNSTAFRLEWPKQPRAGIGAIRLITTNGPSGLHLVLVDPLPGVAASGTNHSFASSQPLTRPGAVDGACEELRSDFYRVTAKKGERFAIEVVARRLGSPLDPLLRLLDAQGRELMANDDAPGLDGDARIDCRCPKTGEYVLEVRDTRHAGGPRHHYRLRLGEPLPTPLPFLASPEVAKLTEPLHPLSPATEREPNDEAGQTQAVQLPVELIGRFDKPGDRDMYEFQAAKGDRLVFAGRTRSLGSPCDLFLQLQTSNGTKVAEANATGADEGLLTNRFNANGAYRLVVEELNRNGGPEFTYRVGVEELRPGFALSTETERVSVPAGDSIEIEVRAERYDYNGAIGLTITGLPPQFSVTNAVIPPKANSATNSVKIKITAPTDLALGDFFQFSIMGRAGIGGQEFASRVSTLPALRNLFPGLRYPPRELDGLLALSISESKSTGVAPSQRRRKK